MMSILPLLLACLSYGVLLQPVESMYMSSPDPSSTDNGDNSELSQSLLKALLQMSDVKNFAQKQMNKADIQCIIGPCDPITGAPLPQPIYPWPYGSYPYGPIGKNDNKAIMSSKSTMSTIQKLDAALKQMSNNELEITDTQRCVCVVSPCPCDIFPAMMARSKKRDMQKRKRPAVRGEKKRGNKVRRGKKKVHGLQGASSHAT